MQQSKQFDIAVVGAGLVGGSAALALARLAGELNIALIDAGTEPQALAAYQCANPEVADFDPRVVALTRSSEEFFQSLGVWRAVAETRIGPYTNMAVWDGEGTARIEFDCCEVGQRNLGHIVENRLLVSALWQAISTRKNISSHLNCKVAELRSETDGQYLLLQDGRQLKAKLVLACDGAHSPLREQQGLATREWDYGHQAIVTTVKTERPHGRVARQRFMATGPLAFLPLAGGVESGEHYCSIVWSCVPELAEQLMALSEKEFSVELGRALEYELGEIQAVAKRFCIPLRQRHASEYIKPGFALAGDAAHTIHPLAGQGVNLGLQDVMAFVEQVEYAQRRGLGLEDISVLRRYQRARQRDNLTMMAAMESFKRLFGSGNIGLRWLRNEGMRQLQNLPWLKHKIIRQAMGL